MFDFILTNICSGYIISNIEHLFREHLFESRYTCIQFYFSVLSGRSRWIFTKKERITMNRRSSRTTQRRKLSKRAKRAKRLFTGFICALIICVSGSAFLVSAQGLSDHDTHTYYKSIEIRKGDTLWDIAEQTKPADCGSTAEYVQVLKDMNRLGSDDIQSGRHLIVACNM